MFTAQRLWPNKMGGIVSFIILMLIGFFFGRANEARHFNRLQREEAELSYITTVNLKKLPKDLEPGGVVVSGNVVIAVDYFKKIAAALRMIIGGRLKSYESLLERARREAIIRMKKQAQAMGANAIYNVRLEFSAIGSQPQAFGGVELLAYGTAVKLK